MLKRTRQLITIGLLLFVPSSHAVSTDELIWLIENEDIPQLQDILNNNSELINQTFDDDYRLLHVATYKQSSSATELLIRLGADVNATDSVGDTPLHNAAMSGCEPCIVLLLEAGADKSLTNKEGYAASSYTDDEYLSAMLSQQGVSREMAVLRDLNNVEEAAFVNALNTALQELPGLKDKRFPDGSNLLHRMAQFRGEVAITALLQQGFDANSQNGDGQTPLMMAVSAENLAAVKALLDAGADVMLKDNEGYAALDYADDYNTDIRQPLLAAVQDQMPHYRELLSSIQAGDADKATKLIDRYNFDFGFSLDNQPSLLFAAVQNGLVEVVQSMAAKGANLSQIKYDDDYNEVSALSLAIEHQDYAMIGALLKLDSKTFSDAETRVSDALKRGDIKLLTVFAENIDGFTELESLTGSWELASAYDDVVSAETPNETLFEFILTHLSFLAASDESGNIDLFPLLSKSSTRLLEIALDKGADPTQLNEDGDNLVAAAIETNAPGALKLLLAKSSQLKQQVDKDSKALDLALAFERWWYLDYLDLGNPVFSKPLENGSTILHQLLAVGDFELAGKLVTKGLSVNVTSATGQSLLHDSVLRGDDAAVNWLLDNNVDTNHADAEGRTGLMLALVNNQQQLAEKLISKSQLNHRDNNGQTSLHLAARYATAPVLKKILKRDKSQLMAFDNHQLLPWHYAFAFARKENLDVLVGGLKEPEPCNQQCTFDDPWLHYIIALTVSGEDEKAVKNMVSQLKKDQFNPLLPLFWSEIQVARDALDKAFADLPKAAQANVKMMKDILSASTDAHDETIFQTYPPENTYGIEDYFSLIKLAYFAQEFDYNQLAIDYFLKALSIEPDLFQAPWALASFTNRSVQDIARIQTAVGSLPDNSATKIYLNQYFQGKLQTNMGHLKAVQNWLAINPYDPRAAVSAGYNLVNNYRYEEALPYHIRGVVYSPFYSNYDKLPETLLRIDQASAAEAFVAEHGALLRCGSSNSQADCPARRHNLLADIYKDTGDQGRARELYQQGIDQWPDEDTNYADLADIEKSDGRKEKALSLYTKAIELAPDETYMLDDYLTLLTGMERWEQAEAVYNRLLNDQGLTKTVYARGIELFARSADKQKALIDQYLSRSQSHTAIKDKLDWMIQQDYPDEFISLFNEVMQSQYFSSFLLTKLAQLLDKHPDAVAESDWLALLAKMPNQMDAHKSYLATFLTDRKDQIRYLQALAEREPQNYWAVMEAVTQMVSEQDWEAAYALLDTYRAQHPVTKDELGYLDDFVINYAWLVYNESRRQIAPQERITEVLDLLDQYFALGGSGYQYHRYREYMFAALNDNVKAAEALLARSKLSKNDTGIFHDLIALYGNSNNRKSGMRYGHEMVRRQPYSVNASKSFMHKHAYWSGSPIAVLREVERIKKLGLNVSYQDYENRVLGQLGDTLSGFKGYLENTMVHPSLRYVNWYDSARQKALFEQSNTINYAFNEEYNEVQIIDEQGFVTIRRDHPIYGNLTFAQRGASWLKYGYTEQGNLETMSTSNGRYIQLTYNDNQHISLMSDNSGRNLSFTYNDIGKPEYIEMAGVGAISVDYDDNGEITRVYSDEGHQIALQVTQAFQNLLSLSKLGEKFLKEGNLPSMTDENHASTQLSNAYQAEESEQAYRRYIDYLVKEVRRDPSYFDTARQMLESRIDQLRWRDDYTSWEEQELSGVVYAMQQWRALMQSVKPEGLPMSEYEYWQQALTSMRNASLQSGSKSATAFLLSRDQSDVSLLRNANWLYKSNFVNEGYWQRHPLSQIFSDLDNVEIHDFIHRANGDLVVATSQGIAIFNGFYWQRYVHQQGMSELQPADPAIKQAWDVTSLLDLEGALWVGTRTGLYRLEGDYTGVLTAVSLDSVTDTPSITSLAAGDDSVLIGLRDQLVSYQLTTSTATPLLEKVRIDAIRPGSHRSHHLLLTADGLYLLQQGQQPEAVTELPVKDAMLLGNQQIWYLTSTNQVFSQQVDNLTLPAQLVIDKSDLALSKTAHGLFALPWPDIGLVPGVNSDLGLNLFANHFVQPFDLPYKRERQGLRLGPQRVINGNNGDVWMLTREGLYGYTPSKVRHIAGKVKSIVSDDNFGVTYAAIDRTIYLISHAGDLSESDIAYPYARLNVNDMVVDQQGYLYANDGFDIVRLQRGQAEPQVLFNARPNVPEDIANWWQGSVRRLFVDSSNRLWVAAGSSVWLWQEGAEPVEFNYANDAERFPSRSQMIFNVYQDIAGDIRVVASNEGHLDYKGVALSGGELIYRDGRFERTEDPYREGWFTAAYTQINPDTAIVGTNGDFFQENKNNRQSFSAIASYADMKSRSPMMWLGGQGADFGDNGSTWLFPSAGGLVAYHNQRWFYPDRLNQLLPQDAFYGQYGGRTVHNVQIDANGRIYAGTDLGLLVYDAQDVESFLISQDQGNWIFVDRDNNHLSALKNIFLDNLDPQSPQAKLVRQIASMESQITRLNTEMAPAKNTTDEQKSTEKPRSQSDLASLKQELERRERARQQLLGKLEAEHFGLFQMLKLDPREAQQLGKKLADGQVLVQYLPTPQRLYINVVEKDQSQITEVNVGADALYALAQQVSVGLKHNSELARGIVVRQNSANTAGGEGLTTQLQRLYDVLLRPIEAQLTDKQHVFISPIKSLSYLPFGALISNKDKEPSFAIEKYNLAVIPSLYHLDLVLSHEKSYSTGELLMADPDGSLPGARNEVTNIKRYLQAPVTLIGEEFTIDNIKNNAFDAKLMHFATHGVLNAESPADSYILLADNKRMDVSTIATLDLSQTDMVVLSACETGIGKEGLEMATIARAFALSNVPTVIASLWKVDDEATERLMTLFYRTLREEEDVVLAFAQAQRKMLRGEARFAHPSSWSAFNVIGRP